MASKRTYPREFKLQAVELVKSGGKSAGEIERELGITPGLLAKWKQRLKVDGQQAFPGKGRLKEDEELIRRLQRENELLRQEREVLKKALSIFSREQP
jgi:Transposase and inactivated derivatives